MPSSMQDPIWSRPCRSRRRAAKDACGCSRFPGVDLQACGGTHVKNTGEIGRLAVARIRSEGKRNKRVTLVFA